VTRGLCVGVAALLAAAGSASAQAPIGRGVIEAIEYPPLEFIEPVVERRDVDGVQVLMLESSELPLVTVHAYFRGGYGLFGRDYYAPAMGLPVLMRNGGTAALPPDSIDELLEFYAIQTTFGSAGGSVTSTMNTLSEHFELAVDLWTDLLTVPRFDSDQIEVWRGRQLESVRRRADDPTRLAFSEFNRLLFGDHPIGWEMNAEDLTPERVSAERFRFVHERVVCRDNLVLGVTGDAEWGDVGDAIERLVRRVRPCPADLPEAPSPDIRRDDGVYVISKDLEQAVIVMAHPTDVRLGDTAEYYAAMIGNAILGTGGFSSRILGRVRTEEGYAYSASSVWTTPREHEGILGAITRTRPENAVPAIEVILGTMQELRELPPTQDEVRTAVDRIVNGFVFNFSSPGQIVARMMVYMAQEYPDDWLERYLQGVQRVTAESILATFQTHLRPEDMTILVVGDPERIGREALETLGPVTLLDVG
jgi:zinc protease